MPQAIPVYVINLDRRPDRLERIAQHLEERGVTWERVSGCDGASASEADLSQIIERRGPLGPLGVGDRACTVSHALAWERFLEGAASHALFLEDDIYLGADLAETLAATDWIPAGADAVKLEKYNSGSSRLLLGPVVGQTPGGRDLRRMRSRHVGGGAYILSRRGAELALGWRGRMRVPVDHFLFNDTLSPVMAALSPVITVPGMATQRKYAYDSDTASHNRAAMPKGLRRRLLTLQRGAFELRRLPMQLLELATGRASLVDVAFAETPPG
ncbi:glycosyltransferase family 25 protein [Roseibacterium sp. SDUM158016]|uniref:glycosyltransferase family 25 protein n=1 Tax=Roseicyclus sediminis TaxID=2980997 RepID=UPI0021CF3389|nr:glycosyltransferase family 25 protein [Roseibacterium sp. SDUM158016]MCU4654179.1 glycosyltransferase family 25 protein [Roseibacterium sp. SDUM158016]